MTTELTPAVQDAACETEPAKTVRKADDQDNVLLPVAAYRQRIRERIAALNKRASNTP